MEIRYMMNQEQAIENLKLIRLNAVMTGAESFKEAVDLAISALTRPSLPSDVDEAAEEYADYNSRRWHEDGDVYYDHSKILEAFKAGAEWMVGKFRKIDGNLVDWYETNGVDYCCGISTDEAFEVPEGFYIRKK